MRLKTVLLLVLACALPSWAQQSQTSGNITSSGTTCSLTAVPTNCVVLQLDGSTGAASIDISGTWAATLQIEAFGGVTWAAINCTPPNSTTAVSSTTANGVWQCNVAGFSSIRIRASAYSSGTAAVVINSAHASAKSGGVPFASGGTTANVIPKSNGAGQLADSPLLAPDANTVRQANTTTVQVFEVYGTTDSNATPVNYEKLTLTYNTGNARFQISADKGGSGTSRSFDFAAANYGFLNGVGGGRTVSISGTGNFLTIGNLTTASYGMPVTQGITAQKAETTTADANVLTFTPPAAIGTYRVTVNISVTSATAGVIAWTLSWTDSSGNAQSNIAMPLFQLGTAAPNTTFTTSVAGNYTGTSTIDVNNAAAAIVVKWVGGGTTAAKMSAFIERIQ